MLLADDMPPTAEALPLIGLYYGVTIFTVSLATGMAVLTVSSLIYLHRHKTKHFCIGQLNIHHRGLHGNNVPPLVQKIAFKYVARFVLLKIEQFHSINDHVEYFHPKNSTAYSNSLVRGYV